jgi:glycine dehydrogenase subunit 1
MGSNYLPNTDQDRQAMLAAIGVASLDDLFADIPANVRLQRQLALPEAMSELDLVRMMTDKADSNQHAGKLPCFLGGGAYDHYVPSVVSHLAGRSEFYTAYTQYQAEISQGGLQALWEYQSMICELTGMDVSNASLYDGGTALAEAMSLACGSTGRNKVLVSAAVNPLYRKVLATYAKDLGFTLDIIPAVYGLSDRDAMIAKCDGETAAVIMQNPNFFGSIEDFSGVAESVHACGALLIASVNPISLAILKSPGQYGVDIAVGEGQPLGLGLQFGGPYLGFMAVKEKLMRRMPGRIVGQTVDSAGRRGFVLTLQAREQHIRREKAYSNICSNEALCAITAAMYLAVNGKQGLRQVADLCLGKAHYLAEELKKLPGYSLAYPAQFFLEFVVKTSEPPASINQRLFTKGIIGGLDLGRFDPDWEGNMLISVTEKRTRNEMDAFVAVLGGKA